MCMSLTDSDPEKDESSLDRSEDDSSLGACSGIVSGGAGKPNVKF